VDCANEFSPNGNDTGADVLELYKEWKSNNKKSTGIMFFENLMKEWEVIIPPSPNDDFSFPTFTEAAIGLAFAQIKIEGKVEEKIKEQALSAIEMQKSIPKEKYLDETIYEERQRNLTFLKDKLQSN
jgi:uncharacterized protein YfeS